MYSLCGIDYPLTAPLWPPVLLAIFVYLAPTVVPWRRAALAVWVLLLVIFILLVEDVFVSYQEDICTPPYDLMQWREITFAGAMSLVVTGYFQVIRSQRPIRWRTPVQTLMATKQFSLAILPAVILVATRVF